MTPSLRGLVVAALLATPWACHRTPLEPQLSPDASVVEDAAQDLLATSDAQSADAPSRTDALSDVPPPPPCQVGDDAPFPHSACPRGALCGCRDDPRAECESVATCSPTPSIGSSADLWVIATPSCARLLPSPCPATVLDARDQPCAPHLADCIYPGNLHCYCLTPFEISWSSSGTCGTPPLRWYCGFDDGPGPCPDGVPELGAACAPDGLACAAPLQPCFNSYARTCQGNTWQPLAQTTECL